MQEARKDGWRSEDDLLLANIVIKHIRNKSTQLAGFAEAAELLGRTESACGFRWNSEVRKSYLNEIKEAKLERNQIQRASVSKQVTIAAIDEQDIKLTITDQIVELARRQQKIIENMAKQIAELKEEIRIKNEQQQLNKKSEAMNEVTLKEDFDTMLQIFQRAKHLI
ncbi:RsfA family transcriptional regulator [Paenibacillus lignilyticus]|uniref:RsfA family transcriptional regulator n=1 Tax=Paenibacillus lignilyticus TaxID=1172615 RepID=A0ABS5CL18_9BACL|nr:RsfA family transcriptional regulator [Paenibacillus lignilyticus]MBP3966545.1 RsfA family transcriptional regulator [Paenibacillus lignilyticus]